MKRFRIVTAVCLGAIALLVSANVWYLWRLYGSIREQTLATVGECVRRADILEIISRLKESSVPGDDSFIRLSFILKGEKTDRGDYEYPNIFENLGSTISETFHFYEQGKLQFPPRDFERLDSMFRLELNNAGLAPRRAFLLPPGEKNAATAGLWSVDFSISDDSEPIATAWISPLNGHILGRMAGIIVTSAAVLALMTFLISYLLRWVGRLRTLEQMKDDFTHNMTHELKTPVAVAFSAADSMLRYYDHSDEARNRRFLTIILQRLGFLSGMIENILSMSMERFSRMKLKLESVALKPLVAEVAQMIEMKADKPVEIVVDIPDNLSIRADVTHLSNVISNLLDNAVKYSGDSVSIRVEADSDRIMVTDNGIGISRANLPRIFDKFYRVTYGDRYDTGGYGLGLFYVRQIVSLHGWSIAATSHLGQGTKFAINLNGNEKG